ncbi:membrane protein [Halobacterium sp. DL1]|jgi:putative membrane protein|nr:membrane protein [Halobacterium sp. DL1]
MTETQGELASLSKYIFRAPRWYTSVALSLVIAALAGIAAFDSQYVLEDAWQGVFFIAVPTIVASLATTPVDRFFGGQLTYNRSSLLAVACEVLVVIVLVTAGVIAVLVPRFGQNFVFDSLIAALALVFAVRFLVVLAVSRNSPIVAAIPASIQTATGGVLLFVYSGTMNFLTGGGPLVGAYLSRPSRAPPEIQYAFAPQDFLLLVLMTTLYGLTAYAFVVIVDRPWKRSLGVSVLDFIRGFIGHIAEGTRELEDFFEQIGEEAVVPVTVLSFRRTSDETEKARFVLPMIHPGPMGEIGGGNLPQRVAETSTGLAFPPHATAGHDFNLVTEREVDTLIETAERAFEKIEYTEQATDSVRVQEGDAKLLGQAVDDRALIVSTYAPEFADDVEYAVGLSAAAEARVEGMDDVLLADAHNCNNGLDGDDLGHVYPGSKRSFDMIQAAGEVARRIRDAPDRDMRLGTAWDRTTWRPTDGIGPLGVRVAVLETGDQRTAYVLVDGNNMEPGLREQLIDALDAVDHAEVMTTDTHIVNTVESSNQVGAALDWDELTALVSELTEEAIEDLEPVEGGMASERAEVTVFGNDRTETLASHANAVIAMSGAIAVLAVLATVTISVLIFFLT